MKNIVDFERVAVIREFYHRGLYRHCIDLDTDKVYLIDIYDLTLLTYDRSGSIHAHDQICSIGKIYLRDNFWRYKWHDGVDTQSKYSINDVEGVLNLEVELSKQWLDRIIKP